MYVDGMIPSCSVDGDGHVAAVARHAGGVVGKAGEIVLRTFRGCLLIAGGEHTGTEKEQRNERQEQPAGSLRRAVEMLKGAGGYMSG